MRTFMSFLALAMVASCRVESYTSPPEMRVVPTEGPNTLVVTVNNAAFPACAGGWVAVVFGPNGTELTQNASSTVQVETDEGWRGYAAVGAKCGTDYHRWGQGLLGRGASDGGMIVRFRGRDLSGVARYCLDPWAPAAWAPVVRPMVPLVATNEGRCP